MTLNAPSCRPELSDSPASKQQQRHLIVSPPTTSSLSTASAAHPPEHHGTVWKQQDQWAQYQAFSPPEASAVQRGAAQLAGLPGREIKRTQTPLN